ncbi:MAG: DUF86 domain-containing protein [Phycisphaerales bacterium]|nr:DUF86 domain-containing protein [Phycisphaerales bacterium]
MQQRDVRHWMWDVRAACDLIVAETSDLSLDDYARDAFRRGGVERQFEIIAEALKRTLAAEPGLSLRFPEANELYRFRNILAHGYHIVDHEKVWAIIKHDVPSLRTKADVILSERPPLNP